MNLPIPPLSAPDDFEDGVRLKLVLSAMPPVVAPDAFESTVLQALQEGGPAATSRPRWLVPTLVLIAMVGTAVLGYLFQPTSGVQQENVVAPTPAMDTLRIPAALHPPAEHNVAKPLPLKRRPRLHGVAGY